MITSKLNMDLQKPGSTPIVHATQSDSYSRNLSISLYTDNTPFVFPVNGKVMIRYRKADGTGGEYDTLPDGRIAWSVSENTLIIALAPQVLISPGSVSLSVSIVSGGTQLNLFPIHLSVHPLSSSKQTKAVDYFYSTGFLHAPDIAHKGQHFRVSEVNEHGRITAIEAFDPEDASTVQVPTQISQLENDCGFITQTVSDLENYYRKSDVYTQEEVRNLISLIPKFSISVVSQLPDKNISGTTIYLIPGGETPDLYTEYIYANNVWEILGCQRIDLTGYATEHWVSGQLSSFQPKGNYAPVSALPTKVSQLINDKSYLTASQILTYLPVWVSFEHTDAAVQFTQVGIPPNILTLSGGYSYAIIPVSEGETYKIHGVHYWQSACYLLTDADGNITRSDGALDEDGETVIQQEFTIQSSEAYLYINNMGPFVSLHKKSVKLDGYYGPLSGKKIVYDGDSICAPWDSSSGNGGAYPKLIADITHGSYDNHAVGGGRLVTAGNDGAFHSIVDNIVNLPTDGDLYCFEGGINDYWHNSPLGSFQFSSYHDTPDTGTLCGALETVFRYCLNHFPGKPFCFVITHKCCDTAYTANALGLTFADYREQMIGICQKYSVPYYDAFAESGLNGWNETQQKRYFIVDKDTGLGDGTHPNVKGFKRYYVPQLIQLFERILPIGTLGEVEDDLPEITYTNVLDTVGWIENVRISSSGELKEYSGRDATGKIPVKYGDIVYLKNVEMPNSSNSYENKIAYWNEDGTLITQYNLTTENTGAYPVYNAEGNLIQFTVNTTCAFIQLGAANIDATSIITVNEPI